MKVPLVSPVGSVGASALRQRCPPDTARPPKAELELGETSAPPKAELELQETFAPPKAELELGETSAHPES